MPPAFRRGNRSHTHLHQWLCLGRNSGFGILPKGTLTYSLQALGIKPMLNSEWDPLRFWIHISLKGSRHMVTLCSSALWKDNFVSQWLSSNLSMGPWALDKSTMKYIKTVGRRTRKERRGVHCCRAFSPEDVKQKPSSRRLNHLIVKNQARAPQVPDR